MIQRFIRSALVALVAMSASAPLAGAQPAKWPSSSPPRPLPAREVKFPPFDVRALSNGLSLVVVAHNEQPAVSMRLIVRAGGAQDPAGKLGLAAMVAALLDQGTSTRTAREVADTIDSAGGSLDTGAARDLSFATITVMKDSLDLGLGLLADVVRRPAFAQEELDRQRRQVVSALRVNYQSPEYLADVVFDRLVYGFQPYGLPENGTPATVERLTRDDLVQFHRRYYAPNNCILAVVGDVTVDEATAAVARAFGDWPRQEIPAETMPAPPKPARRVVVLDKPDAVQTEIRMGQVGIPRKSDDYTAVDLAMRILGGEGANRLHHILRTERGLTYSASADAETLKRSGEFKAQTNTRPEATGEVLRVMMDEFGRLRRERVGDGELSEAKAYLTGHFPLTIETPNDIATQVLDVVFYELPVEELQTFRQRVNAVSTDDIERVATKYLQPDRLSVVLVGNSAAFLDQLKRVGFNRVEVIRLSELDLTAADLRRKDLADARTVPAPGGRWPSGLRNPVSASAQAVARYAGRQAGVSAPSPAGTESALDVIDKAIRAKGGLDRLKAVKTLTAVTQTTFNSPQGPVTTGTTTYIEYPDKVRVEARLPIGEVVQVFAGEDNVWVKDPSKGLVIPPTAARRDFRDSVERDVLPLLLRAHDGQFTLRLVDPRTSPDDSRVIRAVELSATGMAPVTLFVDSTTGMVIRESYELPNEGGTAEESFTDYREVDGVTFPFRGALRRGGLSVLNRVVSDMKVNVPIDPSLFARPARRP